MLAPSRSGALEPIIAQLQLGMDTVILRTGELTSCDYVAQQQPNQFHTNTIPTGTLIGDYRPLPALVGEPVAHWELV
jgi:hypothetical protein